MKPEIVLSEESLDFLESQIPFAAGAASQQAFLESLASGLSVLVAEEGAIYEVFPDGSRRFVKALPPLVEVTLG